MVVRTLKKYKIWHFVKEAAAIRGIPDIIGLTPWGQFFAWELKKDMGEIRLKRSGTSKLTERQALQAHKIKQIKESHGIASFVHPGNFQEELSRLLQRGVNH